MSNEKPICKNCNEQLTTRSKSLLCRGCYMALYMSKRRKIAAERRQALTGSDVVEDGRLTTNIVVEPLAISTASINPMPTRNCRTQDEAIFTCCDAAQLPQVNRDMVVDMVKASTLIPFSIFDDEQREFSALTNASTLNSLLVNDTWKSRVMPCPEPDVSSPTLGGDLPCWDICVRHQLQQSPFKAFRTKKYVEITEELLSIMNTDWTFHPELRLVSAQLFAGAILVEESQLLHINCVEVYGRRPTMDAHFERFFTSKGSSLSSSLPSMNEGIYQNLLVSLGEDSKLVIGTDILNLLVVSSIRLDREVEPEVGPYTAKFKPSRNTRIFLDANSIDDSKKIMETKRESLYPKLDPFCQLRQVRSKFHAKSTYQLCRASSALTNKLTRRPFSVWTLADSDNSGTTESDAILASKVFQRVALAVLVRNGKLDRAELEALKNRRKTLVQSTLREILGLFEGDHIFVIGNTTFDALLRKLADAISTDIRKANDSVVQHIQHAFSQMK